jgi:hypothetical protein
MLNYEKEINHALLYFIEHIRWRNSTPSNLHLKMNQKKLVNNQETKEWRTIPDNEIERFSHAFISRLKEHLTYYPIAALENDHKPLYLLLEIVDDAKLSDKAFFQVNGLRPFKWSIEITQGKVVFFPENKPPYIIYQA